MVRASWTLDCSYMRPKFLENFHLTSYILHLTDIPQEKCSGVCMEADIEHMANLEGRETAGLS